MSRDWVVKTEGERERPQHWYQNAVYAIAWQLRGKADYDTTFLTYNAMGIEKFPQLVRDRFLPPVIGSQYRERFRKEIAFFPKGLKIHIFGKVNSGNEPDCIFVWKVQKVNGDRHEGNVAKAIHTCNQMLPK